MSSFQLTNHIEATHQDAKHLLTSLKAIQQTLQATNTSTTILRDLNICVFAAQQLCSESFLFIEKEAINARKTTDFVTTTAISEIVDGLADRTHISSTQTHLGGLVLEHYFHGPGGDENCKRLEEKLKTATEVGSLGDFP